MLIGVQLFVTVFFSLMILHHSLIMMVPPPEDRKKYSGPVSILSVFISNDV